jgi:hypothetical protein
MIVPTRVRFSDERDDAVAALSSISSGRGWCNVVAEVVDDVPDLTVNVFGLWVNQGAAVASFVTSAPRDGVAQPSTLGLLHSRGRLGKDRISALIGDAPFAVRQDHNARGLLLSVSPDAPAAQVLDVMCDLTSALCDYPTTGRWRLDLFVRP